MSGLGAFMPMARHACGISSLAAAFTQRVQLNSRGLAHNSQTSLTFPDPRSLFQSQVPAPFLSLFMRSRLQFAFSY